ncbi:MAG: hypothetical protein RDV48_28775 [Candidatus Eremiobacteraeota bacterium]|nr:hypothetical protein [Candidatus Eremiobacteraeota bacterium]
MKVPLKKFRTIEEMNAGSAPEGGNSAARMEALAALMETMVPPLCRRGVRKFRTIEEANEARLTLERERAEKLREKR